MLFIKSAAQTSRSELAPATKYHSRLRKADWAPASNSQRNVTISVIIPAKNEAKNLPYVLPLIPSWVYEVILVDGHSTDDTIEVARALMPGIRIITQSGKGKGNALCTGFEAARGEIIVMLDADGSTDPGEIPVFCGLLAKSDFVKGSRFMQGGGTTDMEFHRKLGNLGLGIVLKLFFGGKFSDLCYGYMAFWKRVIPQLYLDCDGFEVETLMSVRALRAKLKIAEAPSFEYPRIYGKSNLRAIPDGWRVLKTIFREATHHYFDPILKRNCPETAVKGGPLPKKFAKKVTFNNTPA